MITPKQIVESFFSRITAGKIQEAFELVSDDVVWWIPEGLPFSGTKNKQEYLAIVNRIQAGFPSGFKLEVKDMTIEGSKVAAEVESDGLHVNGKKYNNKYHFLIVTKDQKFSVVKEYMNTLHLATLIG